MVQVQQVQQRGVSQRPRRPRDGHVSRQAYGMPRISLKADIGAFGTLEQRLVFM